MKVGVIMSDIDKLISIIKESNNIVFFGGAGVSTESGLKDFRSKDGLYNEQYKYPPEVILSHSFFMKNPEEFFKFYYNKMNPTSFKPNIVHYTLTDLERSGKLKAIITQNIDGFHQDAGSKNVLELHGSVRRNYCMKCSKFYDEKKVFESTSIPYCECGGIIKPDVVLYEEPLDKETVNKTINAISDADTLIVGGTSLVVYPAASFIRFFKGKHLIIINNDSTPMDNKATLVIQKPLGEVFTKIKEALFTSDEK